MLKDLNFNMLLFFALVLSVKGQNIINFNSNEGFVNGLLNNQSNWSSNNQSVTWEVNTISQEIFTNGNWKRASWNQPFVLSEVGDEITFFLDLYFKGTINEVSYPLFKVGFSTSSNVEYTNPTSNTIFLSSINDPENYNNPIIQLRHNNNSNSLIPDSFLELSTVQGQNEKTDSLRIQVTLTLGDDASNTKISSKLFNISDNTETSLGEYNGVNQDLFNATKSGVYFFFSSQDLNKIHNNNALSSVNVSKINFELNSKINLYPKTKRSIGGTSKLDRGKFFNLHSTGGDDVEASIYSDYNISINGRAFWGPASFAQWKLGTDEVGTYPEPITGNNNLKNVSKFISTEHPVKIYREGIDKDALADWVVEYFNNYVDEKNRPEYYEPMNEPFVNARNFYSEPDWNEIAENRVKLEMAEVFKEIGIRMRNTPSLEKMKIIGYSAAFPSFEKNNFGIWEENMKMFMDVAGEYMHGFSTHLYDGINVIGKETKRSGSNMEAILDLIESYSYEKWQMIKPHVISEFGGITSSSQYSDINNVQSIRSQNSMLFDLFEREDRIEMVIPFNTGKSTWHISESNNYLPYKAVLYKPENIGQPIDENTVWIYTDRIYFYELWKEIEGDRFLINSNNPDVQVQGFKQNENLYVAINNLDDFTQTLKLSGINENEISSVSVKSLIINPNEAILYSEETYQNNIEEYLLRPNETLIIKYNFQTNFDFENLIQSNRYYDNNNIRPIETNNELIYEFNNINLISSGFAKIRMSIARHHQLSKMPVVKINDNLLKVPGNWRGYDQSNRDEFFGMIEINVPVEYVKNNNIININFPDSGGYISSIVFVTETFDTTFSTYKKHNESYLNKLKIFPNPSNGLFHLDNKYEGELIKVYDISGKKIHKEKFNGISLNLNHLQSGPYFVELKTKVSKILIK